MLRDRDPLGWCWAITLAFLALAAWGISTPSITYFDEVHYVPAARKLLQLLHANSEHPLLGKEAIATSIALLGDRPLAWRLPSLLTGGLGLFAFGRALWWASGRRFATVVGMVLLASDFAWFIQSRIAMLDMVMAGLAMVVLWQLAAATAATSAGSARARLAVAGIAIGLSLGAKWSVLPVFALLGVAVVASRLVAAGPRALEARDAPPFRGLALAEIVLWLFSVPLAVYYLTFLPAFFYRDAPVAPGAIVAWHATMVALQDSVVQRHPYQSVWWQWALDQRDIWYLYQPVDGAQRGIVLLGNPVTMWLGLPALAWCGWAAIARGRRDAGAALALWAVTLGMWAVSGKPVQFYYHYLLPGSFLVAGLALALDAVWRHGGGWRWLALAVPVAALMVFAEFLPIIAAWPLHHGVMSFEHWMWLRSWR